MLELNEKISRVIVIVLIILTIFLIISMMIFLFWFSGGIPFPPKRDLEKQIVRIYDDTEELSVISFIENYDFLDFIPLEENDSRVFTEFTWGTIHDNTFVRNISDFLTRAEVHYNSSKGLVTGSLDYIIDCANSSSSSSLSDVLQLVKQLQDSQKDWVEDQYQYPISEQFNFATYYLPNNSTIQIESGEVGYAKEEFSYSKSLLSNISMTNLMWTVLIDLRYSEGARIHGCLACYFTELILLSSDFEVIAFFSLGEGAVC